MSGMSRSEAADQIEAFLNGTSGKWDWDEFTSLRLKDPELEKVRLVCVALPDIDPPTKPNHYCGESGMKTLAELVTMLKTVE